MNRDMRRHRKEWDWAEELLYEDSDFIPQGSDEKPGEWDIDKDIREIREDLSKYYFSREYATRQEKKRLVDQEFDKMGELMKRFSFADDTQEIPISKKRKTALLHLIDRIETEISTDNEVRESLRGLLSLPETLCNFELLPVRKPYDTLDYYENITLAAALWILDDLKRSRKLYEAYSFLPADYSEIYEADIPTNFYDTCYDEDLIRSVMCVIIDRNRRRDKDEKVSIEQKIYCDVADAQEQKPQTVYRSRFDGLFSLINQNRAERAAEHFREKQMAVIQKYLSCMAIFDRRDTDLVRPILQTSSLLVVKQSVPDEEKLFGIMRGIEDNQEDRADFEQGFVEYLGKSFREIKRETGNKEISKSLSDFMVDDPYETCFALLYLLEKGHARYV